MHKKHPLVRDWRPFLTIVGAAVTSGLAAQTAAPAADAPASAKPADDEVYVMNPFEVSVDSDVGYAATQTLAGTRIRTDLKDVATSITVVNKQFMSDIGATDNSTLLQYTPNADVAGTHGTYAGLGNATSVNESTTLLNQGIGQRVRGLASADNARDYFVSDIPWDSYNVDRVDIQRGPNAMLFGLGSPAGIVNASLHSAQFTNSGNAEFRFGSYGTTRSSLDVNQQIIDNVLAVRIDGLWNQQKYEQKQAFQDDRRVFGALRWSPKLFGPEFATTVNAKFENGNIKANRPRIVPPYDSITPWFASTANGGAGKYSVSNIYDLGSSPFTTNPWLTSQVANQQQPIWFIDGSSNALYRIYGGYVNTGARDSNGAVLSSSSNLVGQRYADMFDSLSSYSTYATRANLVNNQYGQYRDKSLTDSSVFDFYKNLIDGDTKSEWEDWNAYNLTFNQTGWGDRVSLDLSFDYQKYTRGGQQLLGNPTIGIDITKTFSDLSSNSNYGRPFVTGGPGSGSLYTSTRKFFRGTAYGELRASDFFANEFLIKLLGRSRITGTYSHESYQTENRTWQEYAHTIGWSSYWRRDSGLSQSIDDRAPVAVIYLGSSLANATTASGAGFSGITSDVKLQDGSLYYFDSTWTAFNVPFNSAWTVPANLSGTMFPTTNPPTTQASNPANYVGWNSKYQINLMRYNMGEDNSLLTKAQKSMRQTDSYSGSWQSYLWNESLIGTFGWRYDRVKSKNVSAAKNSSNRNILNLSPDAYKLPTKFSSDYQSHITTGSVVLHLNKAIPEGWDKYVPLNVSLTWDDSKNFQVTDARVDVYGQPIDNPTGHTKEFGLMLGTKDGKYTFRVVKYDTQMKGASSSLYLEGLNGVVQQGLKWRNVFLYRLTAYDWATRENTAGGVQGVEPDDKGQYQYRPNWFPAWVNASGQMVAGAPDSNHDYVLDDGATPPAGATRMQTRAESDAMRDASIRSWNSIQAFLDARGYFKAWGYTPTTLSALTDRATLEAAKIAAGGTWNSTTYPAQYTPVASTVASYSGTRPVGGTVTEDYESKGYEFEFTANPISGLRIQLSASQTEASHMNVGGAAIQEMVNYMAPLLAGAAGDMRQYNGDATGSQVRVNWNSWYGQYMLLKLQENAAASEIRKWRYNIVASYDFQDGFLKGFGVGSAYRWQDKVVIGYPLSVKNNQVNYDLTKPYYGPSEDGLDFWVSYTRPITDKVTWKIQLNIRNAFDDDGLIPISVEPDGTTWASVRVKPVQEWTLTNTFTF